MASIIWLERMEATRPYQPLRYPMNRQFVAFLRRTALHGHGLRVLAQVACGSGYSAGL